MSRFNYKEYSEQLENSLEGLRAKNRELKAQIKALKILAMKAEIESLRTQIIPKEQNLAGTAYRVHCVARERGEFPDYWHKDFATMKEAKNYMKKINSKNTSPTAPDYYEQAERIEKVEVTEDNK